MVRICAPSVCFWSDNKFLLVCSPSKSVLTGTVCFCFGGCSIDNRLLVLCFVGSVSRFVGQVNGDFDHGYDVDKVVSAVSSFVMPLRYRESMLLLSTSKHCLFFFL